MNTETATGCLDFIKAVKTKLIDLSSKINAKNRKITERNSEFKGGIRKTGLDRFKDAVANFFDDLKSHFRTSDEEKFEQYAQLLTKDFKNKILGTIKMLEKPSEKQDALFALATHIKNLQNKIGLKFYGKPQAKLLKQFSSEIFKYVESSRELSPQFRFEFSGKFSSFEGRNEFPT